MTKIRHERQVTSWVKEGEAQPLAEAEEEFLDKPEEWEHILANAHQFTCQVRGIPMIVAKPKYTFKDSAEIHNVSDRKRTIETECNIKKAKAPKVVKQEVVETPQLQNVFRGYNNAKLFGAPSLNWFSG